MDDLTDRWLDKARPADTGPSSPTAPPAATTDLTDRWVPREPTPGEYALQQHTAGLNVGRSPEEHEKVLRDRGLGDEAVKRLTLDYKLAKARRDRPEYGTKDTLAGAVIQQVGRNYTPFGDLFDNKRTGDLDQARRKFRDGTATDEDVKTIAGLEAVKAGEAELAKSTTGAILSGVGTVPKLVAESWAAGKVLSSLGAVVPGALGRTMVGGAEAATSLRTQAGRLALTLPLMPSMYLDEVRQRNEQAGRPPLDVRGWPGSVLHGYANLLVLGRLQGKVLGSGSLGSVAKAAGIGVGEQAGLDVAGGLWDEVMPDVLQTKTRYGVLGDLARGDYGEAAKHATVQALTFAMFAGLHGGPKDPAVKVKDAADFYVEEVDKAARGGASVESAAGAAGAKVEAKAKEEVKASDADMTADARVRVSGPVPGAPPVTPGEWTPPRPGQPPTPPPVPPGTPTEAAKTPVDDTPQSPTVAPVEPKPPPAPDAPGPEIAPPGASGEAGKPVPPPGEAPKPPEPPAVSETPTVQAALTEGQKAYQAELVSGGLPYEAERSIDRVTAGGKLDPAEALALKGMAAGHAPSGKELAAGLGLSRQGAKNVAERALEKYRELDPTGAAEIGKIVSRVPGEAANRERPDKRRKLRPPSSDERGMIEATAAEAARSDATLTDEQRAEFTEAVGRVLDTLPPGALGAVAKNLKGVKFYATPEAAGIAQVEAMLRRPDLSDRLRADLSARLAAWKAGARVDAVGGFDGTHVHIDGSVARGLAGRHGTAELSSFMIAAHELGHAIDGIRHDLSNTPEWQVAYINEIYRLEGGRSRLTDYARGDRPGGSTSEGFAEFARLVYGSDVPTAVIARDFPRATRFFKDHGLWPAERGTGGAKPAESIPEVFTERLGEPGKAAHVDVGETRVPRGAPSPEGEAGEMRTPREREETADERDLLKAVQAAPLENTPRLALADAIQEGGGEARAAGVRRDVTEPPGPRGVSDWWELHHEQVGKAMRSPRFQEILRDERRKTARAPEPGEDYKEIADGRSVDQRALDRYFAERGAAGERLEFKLPADPDADWAFPEGGGTHPLTEFGPRLYQGTGPEQALFLAGRHGFEGWRLPPYLFPVLTTHPDGRIHHIGREMATLEFSTEHAWGVTAGLERGGNWRQRYDRGIAEAHLPEGTDPHALAHAILSVTLEKGVDSRSSHTAGQIESLLEQGWRRVELPDGRVRLDSPLRQQLRGEQALGYRTGEAGLLRVPSLKDLGEAASKALGGADGKKALRSFFRGLLTGPGDLPASAFEEKLTGENRVSAEALSVGHAVNDLTAAVGGDWRAVPKDVIETMDAALRDPDQMARLRDEIRIPLKRMRDHVDALSNELIKVGTLSEKLELTFKENLGAYLTRQFQVWTDPAWYAKARELDGGRIVNEFKSWFKEEARRDGRDLSDADLEGVVEKLLRNGTAAENPIAFIAHSKLGAKDIGILTKRKDIPEPLRALWGEVKDPIANYAATVGRMANLLSNHIFQTRVRAIGLADGWLSEKPTRDLPVEIAPGPTGRPDSRPTSGSRTMDVLAGLHTTPEIKRAFESVYAPENLPGYLKAYMKVLGVFKYTHTVLSPVTHVRQLLGNVFFNIANGHGISPEANRMIREILKDSEAGRAYQRRLVELGIDDQSARGSEFRAVLEDALGSHDRFALSTAVADNAVARWLKKGLDFAQKSYRYEDLVVKIHAFENEKARYTKAGLTPEAAEAKAAKIVQDTFPTYSRIPGGLKALRRFPLVGSFVSFTSEVVRNTYNTAKLASQELRDPALREVGARRMAGLAVSLSAFAALGALTRQLAGVTLDEEDALRRSLPEWSKNGQLLHLGKDEKGNYRVVDLGRTDPHSNLLEPLQAAVSGARSGTGTVYDVLEAAANPFVSEELGTRVALDVARNKMEKGAGEGRGQVYNPEDATWDQFASVTAHAWKGLEPGAVREVLQAGRAASGVPDPRTNKPLSVGEEFLADFTGQRVLTVDPRESLAIHAREFARRLEDAEHPLLAAASLAKRGGGTPTAEGLADPYARSEALRRGVYDDLLDDVRAARLTGMTDGEIARALTSSGVSKADVGLVLGGRYQPRNLQGVLRKR